VYIHRPMHKEKLIVNQLLKFMVLTIGNLNICIVCTQTQLHLHLLQTILSNLLTTKSNSTCLLMQMLKLHLDPSKFDVIQFSAV